MLYTHKNFYSNQNFQARRISLYARYSNTRILDESRLTLFPKFFILFLNTYQQSRFLQNPINNPQHLHNVQHSRHLNVATNVHCYHLDERLSLSLSPHILKISKNTRDFPRPEKFPRIYIFTPSSHVTALRSCFASRKL